MSVIRTVIGETVESGATITILPEDGSTLQAFLLRIERRYTQMALEPREWRSALINHFVVPALTYWVLDVSSENYRPKRLGDGAAQAFGAVRQNNVAESIVNGVGKRLPTDLHLLITNNGQVKYPSWEQAATAATRLYEPKHSVLELRARTSRAIRAAIQANGPRGRQEIENHPGGTHTNCFECQGRGHPARVCPRKGERTKLPAEICKKCGGVGRYAWDCPTYERGRTEPEDKRIRGSIRPRAEKTEQLNRGA
ncbi:hypothetical protein ENH_00030260 [Eimeria necatrix]|uniref:CCHC-type domain-containing protein n=1 Tax=Eimeria necatrix TaxID=51315 RepID=U6MII1_9EIME|nr:hypothetical protein ENH_00030260 [Eimeria necatrix]CDJ62883.1 hypothetical protein ENH_00030260 [Eimeria necatrix]